MGNVKAQHNESTICHSRLQTTLIRDVPLLLIRHKVITSFKLRVVVEMIDLVGMSIGMGKEDSVQSTYMCHGALVHGLALVGLEGTN